MMTRLSELQAINATLVGGIGVTVTGGATAANQATELASLASIVSALGTLLAELQQKTEPSDTQHISATALPLPAGASTEATLAFIRTATEKIDDFISGARGLVTEDNSAAIKAKTDNLDILLSTVKTVLDSIKAKTDNLDVALSTRTKPADAQHVIIDSSAAVPVSGPLTDTQLRLTAVAVSAVALPLPAGASTEVTLALIKAKTDNLDVALSTRTKAADSQHVTVDNAAVPVSAASLPLPTGAAIETGNLALILTALLAAARLVDTQPVTDASLLAAIGSGDTPYAGTLLEELRRIRSELRTANKIGATEQTLRKLTPPALPRSSTTLLHRY